MGAAVPVTFVVFPVDGLYRTTTVEGFLGVSIGVVAAGTAGCGLGVVGATRAVSGLLVLVSLGATQLRTLV